MYEDNVMELDWEKAEQYLKEAESAYAEIGASGAFAMRAVIMPCRDRFNSGERSQSLHDEIFDIAL